MLIRTHNYQAADHKGAERKGVILLVVISLLTLFAIVGLSFVLYANAEANASKIYREAANQNQIDMEPELLFNMFLGQLIYDVNDDYTGVYSAMRGHSLGRGICGLNYNGAPSNMTLENFAGLTSTSPPPGTPLGPLNAVPFNGTGRLHVPNPTYGTLMFQDDYQLVNYTYFQTDGFLRDPERLGARANLGALPGQYAGGFNAPYTYPDLNNMFLAAVKADGTVLMPSFHRHWLFNPSNLLNDQGNPNWTNPQGKYLILRPRPVDQLLAGETFPPNRPFFDYPEDAGGDVKNLPGPGYRDAAGNYWNNDSIWMDFGAPVMTAPNGTKFKALFAPLIIDLDGRINLNVAGNVRGWEPGMSASGNPPHASNQGWGPWEMNLGYVLPQPNANGAPEWAGLFLGSGQNQGRYGQDLQPYASGSSAQPGTMPHFYGQVDFDGCNEQNGYQPSGPINLPQAGSFTSFSSYLQLGTGAPQGWGNGSGGAPGTERWNHPLLYNYFQPNYSQLSGDDRVFGLSNMEALLRYGDTNSPFLTSDLFRLCPNNFQNARMRNLVTTMSYDVDQPGVSPWVYNNPSGTSSYGMNTYAEGTALPTPPQGGAIAFPTLPPAGQNGEFGFDWRAVSAALGRVNLNRNLTAYATNQVQATIDRQQFAADIFIRLVFVTGAYDLNNPIPISSKNQYDALRWLAQLAANIVDFIDNDDVMTPFPWAIQTFTAGALPGPNQAYANYPQYQNAINAFQTAAATFDIPTAPTQLAGGRGWVFGTELPRVVINEAYAEYTGGDTPTGMAGKPYQVTVWVELHNPFNPDTGADPNNGNADLHTNQAYRVALAKASSAHLRVAGNATGDITSLDQYQDMNYPPIGAPAITPFTNNEWVSLQAPLPPPQTAPGFLLIGGDTTPAPDGNAYPTLKYKLPPHDPPMVAPADPPDSSTILLQRLSNPYTAGNTNSADWGYNPYVTTDYMEGGPSAGGYWKVAAKGAGGSWGRLQPYAATAGLVQQQANNASTPPNTTFRQVNQSGSPPSVNNGNAFNWLTHLDRQIVSPMELLQVSAYKPHELTQQFVNALGTASQHLVPWFDGDPNLTAGNSHRLWRIFEFLETGNRAAGMTPGGRVPGKININTFWDVEPFQTMSDPQMSNSFTIGTNDQRDVNNIFQNLLQLRSPKGYPDVDDVPFVGMAAAFTNPMDVQYPKGSGIGRTLLRPPSAGPSADQSAVLQLPMSILTKQTPPQGHPYFQDMLLSKIFNNITTRSNVFAVWVTVGFFEVVQETDPATGAPVRPVKLGAEIGKAENRHIRHRMFAIVDRSSLTTEKYNPKQVLPPPVYLNGSTYTPNPVPPAAATNATITIQEGGFSPGDPATGFGAKLSGFYEGLPWGIQSYQPPVAGGFPILGTNLLIDTGASQELVNVIGMTQPTGTAPTNITVNGNPNLLAHASPTAVIPVSTITAYDAIAKGTPGLGNPPVSVRVSPVNGIFEGVAWSLQAPTASQPGTTILIDVGSKQEPAVVQAIAPPAGPGQPYTILLSPANSNGQFAFDHAPGALGGYTISYPIPTPGNPGPQPNFNMRQVPWVVRYFSIVN